MYIVTGVSRGLGQAVVQTLLGRKQQVIGIGRSHSFNDSNFMFIPCDLSDVSAVKNIALPEITEPVTLINNAGVIGTVKRISDQDVSDIQHVLTVNVSSPVLLTQKVYSVLENKSNLTLVNISSGAANRAIPSWAAYCSSKAALNMFSETFFLEEREKNNVVKVYSVAPGVIDTDMQTTIRSADQSDFSSLENFQELKNSDALFSPEEAANRLLKLLDLPYSEENLFADLRQI